MMLEVTLYSKPDCGLCDEAEVLLAEMAAQVPHSLTVVNIETDAHLFETMYLRIPVVEVGPLRLEAPIDAALLLEAMDEALASQESG